MTYKGLENILSSLTNSRSGESNLCTLNLGWSGVPSRLKKEPGRLEELAGKGVKQVRFRINAFHSSTHTEIEDFLLKVLKHFDELDSVHLRTASRDFFMKVVNHFERTVDVTCDKIIITHENFSLPSAKQFWSGLTFNVKCLTLKNLMGNKKSAVFLKELARKCSRVIALEISISDYLKEAIPEACNILRERLSYLTIGCMHDDCSHGCEDVVMNAVSNTN